MMAGHGGGNMVGQTSSQGPFLAQNQFPPGAAVATTGAMNVTVGPGMGQPPAQAAVTQVGYVEGQTVWGYHKPCWMMVSLVLFHFVFATVLCQLQLAAGDLSSEQYHQSYYTLIALEVVNTDHKVLSKL